MTKDEILSDIEAELMRDENVISVGLAPDVFTLLERPSGFRLDDGREILCDEDASIPSMRSQFRLPPGVRPKPVAERSDAP